MFQWIVVPLSLQCISVCSAWLWRWRHHDPLKCWELLMQCHSIMCQMWLFSNTAVRTLNLALWYLADWQGTPKQWWFIEWHFLGQNGDLWLYDVRVTGEQTDISRKTYSS
jgi:hypothetical protein